MYKKPHLHGRPTHQDLGKVLRVSGQVLNAPILSMTQHRALKNPGLAALVNCRAKDLVISSWVILSSQLLDPSRQKPVSKPVSGEECRYAILQPAQLVSSHRCIITSLSWLKALKLKVAWCTHASPIVVSHSFRRACNHLQPVRKLRSMSWLIDVTEAFPEQSLMSAWSYARPRTLYNCCTK